MNGVGSYLIQVLALKDLADPINRFGPTHPNNANRAFTQGSRNRHNGIRNVHLKRSFLFHIKKCSTKNPVGSIRKHFDCFYNCFGYCSKTSPNPQARLKDPVSILLSLQQLQFAHSPEANSGRPDRLKQVVQGRWWLTSNFLEPGLGLVEP